MADPQMPPFMTTWMRKRDWGTHHVQWHVVRIWDLLDPGTIQWAVSRGWSKYAVQEGEPGNGLEFLAMHRVMIRQLRTAFPANSGLFAGWPIPPTDPRDPNDPLPDNATTPFSANMTAAITRLHGNLQSFASDDEFGLFIETSLRPVAGDPARQSADFSAGIHNYLHGRFQDENSPVDMGDPTVNIENERFWRLHGWIDSRWSAFRSVKGLDDNDPAYRVALTAAEHHMTGHVHEFHPASVGMEGGAQTVIPAAVRRDVRETLRARVRAEDLQPAP